LGDLAGNFVFLNFWATWCPPCRAEMPSMEVLYQELKDRPFRMIAVNINEDQKTVQGFVDEFGYTYPILLDRDGNVSTNYGVRGIPTSFFIGPDGTVLGMLVGTRLWDGEDVMTGMKRIMEIVASR
jgi:thiol-disulfide isomerase/thioredoxin